MMINEPKKKVRFDKELVNTLIRHLVELDATKYMHLKREQNCKDL